jgi:transposase
MKKTIIGIDISAKTLDLCIKKEHAKEFIEIENSVKSINKFFKKFSNNPQSIIVSMENTGKYNWNLYEVLEKMNFTVFVIHPFHLKKSLGLIRGKNDKIDAERIATFTEKNKEELTKWIPCSSEINQIKIISSQRKFMVKSRSKILQQQKEYQLIKVKNLKTKLVNMGKKNIELLTKQIKELDQLLEEIIKQDQEIKTQIERMRSIPGVGKVLSCAILAKTEGFRIYKEPRKLACCAGVVPFNYQSGTSINSKFKVSHLADKSLKTLLHMASMRAVRLDCDLKLYYQRKVAQGKNKMSVLNAVRNKLIHIIYALIKNEKYYQNNLMLS